MRITESIHHLHLEYEAQESGEFLDVDRSFFCDLNVNHKDATEEYAKESGHLESHIQARRAKQVHIASKTRELATHIASKEAQRVRQWKCGQN